MENNWPKGWEWLGALAGVAGAFLMGVPVPFWALLGLQALDLFSGVLTAIRVSDPLSSSKMRNGLIGKTQVWILVGSAWLIALAAPDQVKEMGLLPSAALAGAFAVAEFISICENAVRGGAWLPDVLKRVLQPVPPNG